jgi:O-antigen/teichoic acid export membrane protein
VSKQKRNMIREADRPGVADGTSSPPGIHMPRPASDSVLRRALVRGAGMAFLLQILGLLLTYGLHVVFARWLGAGGYGRYAYVLSWATVLATIAALGLPLVSLRFGSQHKAAQRWGALRGLLRGTSILVGLGGTAIFAIGAGLAFATASDPLLWLAGLACVPLLAQLALGTETARAMGSVAASLAPPRVFRPLLTLVAVAIVWRHATGPATALAATAIALFVATLLQWIWIRVLMPERAQRGQPVYRTWLWLKVGFPLMIAAGVSLLLTQLDLLMVGLLMDEQSTGLYSAAAKTAGILPFVLYAFNTAAAPDFASLHERGDHRELQALASRVVRLAFWPSLAIAFVLSVSAGLILALFGDPFVGAHGVVVVLAAGYMFSAGVGSVGYLLNLTGHEQHNARTLIVAVGINIVLNLSFIPVMGIYGASLATMLTWVFVGVRLDYLTRRHVGVRASILAAMSRREYVH